MWQKLYEELESQGLTVLTVAMDSRPGASRRYIERARPTHPSLIDSNHLVAELYNMTNVPQAVWIDEKGHLVRPTETAGFSISRKFRDVRKHYLEAIRDWAAKGEQSKFVQSSAEASERMPKFSPKLALAHATFHLGQALSKHGNKEEALEVIRKAVELHPQSWNFYRQMKNLEKPWKASGPAYFARAISRAFKGEEYYPLADMPGMAEILGKDGSK